MPPADTPDFDSMTPEEVMAWMESLAKRQGASEGFTTAADMQIAEVDPSSVQIDEPGYVPFGQESSRKPVEKPAEKPAAAAPPPPPVETPPPSPPVAAEQETEPVSTSGMAWLESLAADSGGDFPQMDLSELAEEIEPEPVQLESPLDWLENLAQSEGMADLAADEDEIDIEDLEAIEDTAVLDAKMAKIDDPLAAGVDPMLWLESLARRQGVPDEELLTAADMVLDDVDADEEDAITDDVDFLAVEEEVTDPAAWLDSLASGQGFETTRPREEPAPTTSGMSDADIQSALNTGEDIPPEQMAAFLDRQLQRQLEGGDIPLPVDEDFDPDAPPIPADIPEWLLEQVQRPVEETPTTPEQPPLIDEIVEPPAAADLPDWLKPEAEEEDSTLENIFVPEAQAAEPNAFAPELESDIDDPWVEAFQDEQKELDSEPDWYREAINDPARIAAVERLAHGITDEDDTLQEAELESESSLSVGQRMAVPDWAAAVDADEFIEDQEEEAVAIPAEIPDWLSGAADDEAVAGDIPSWLIDDEEAPAATGEMPDWLIDVEEEATPDVIIPEPEPEPAPLVQVTPAPPPQPTPQPRPDASPVPAPAAAAVDVSGALHEAREKAKVGDVDGALVAYESIVRANSELPTVSADLARMIESGAQENPAVYRVLGDSLMRQGKLQAALDTYRKALNQL